MNEVEFLTSNGFVAVDRKEQLEALQFNDDIRYEYKINDYGMKYCVIRNVLKYPDKFITLLKRHPGYGGSIQVTSPGFRQLLSPIEYSSLLNMYNNVCDALNGVKTNINVLRWVCCSNIFYNGMKGNPRPHPDGSNNASNLWLSQGMEKAGTGFYRLKIENSIYYNFKDVKQEHMKVFSSILQNNQKDIVPWFGFDKDEHWELYDVIPAEFNSAVIYNGNWFHNAYYEPKNWDSNKVRYSFVSFLQESI